MPPATSAATRSSIHASISARLSASIRSRPLVGWTGSRIGASHGEYARDRCGIPLPAVGFGDELRAPIRGQIVDPHAPFRLRCSPSRSDEPFALEAVQAL